jgi:hypothetical protein
VTYKGLVNPIALHYNSIGLARVQLPAGPQDDSFKVHLFTRIIDDLDGVTEYKLNNSIIVNPNFDVANTCLNEMLNNKNTKTFVKQLFTGNLQQTTQNIISLSSTLNQLSSSNQVFTLRGIIRIFFNFQET